MKYQLYVIMQPGADRPYISHTPPTEFQKKPGAKVFDFMLDIPGFEADETLGVIRLAKVEYERCGRSACWCKDMRDPMGGHHVR